MLTFFVGLGWIPFWLGMKVYFKVKARKDMDETISRGFKVLVETGYVDRLFGSRESKSRESEKK